MSSFWFLVALSVFWTTAIGMLIRDARRSWRKWRDWHCFEWSFTTWSWPEVSDDYDEFGITHRYRFIGPVQMRYWL